MKAWNNTGLENSHDIIHMWGDKDLYTIDSEGDNLVFESASLGRKYIVSKDSETVRFKMSDDEAKKEYKYIDLVNVYGIKKSCKEILDGNSEAQNGLYIIKPDGVNKQQVYCDMSEGWTLMFSYDTADHNTVDETAFPTKEASRDKLLSKVWGMTDNLHGTGHTVGNISPMFKDYIVNGQTEVMAEVVRVDNGDRIRAERFQVQDKDFIDRVHTGNQMDCWTSMDGGSRLIIANYISPTYTYNKTLKAGCTGGANSHSVTGSNMVNSGNWGIDGALIFSDEGSGKYSRIDKELSIHVNWYADRNSEDLYDGDTSHSVTKWGTTATWSYNAYGRNGDTPGPMICSSDCGYTNNSQNVFKMRLWVK